MLVFVGRSLSVTGRTTFVPIVYREMKFHYTGFTRVSPICWNNDRFMLRKKGKGKDVSKEKNEESSQEVDWGVPKTEMGEVIKGLTAQFAQLRVGRADPSLLDGVTVNLRATSGKSVPLSHLAEVRVKDGSTLSVSAYDPNTIKDLIVALQDSDLNLSPTLSGQILIVPIPSPTKEFRERMVKLAAKHSEAARVEIRQIRKKLISDIKACKLPEDEDRKAQQNAQVLHDQFIKQIENSFKEKEKMLLSDKK
eukprot:TRINITY_DN1976_c0_g2_i3.p1 TRINITY_DN1976_c0_g2~~TRINITY_DN1976_c0_g2_i3.p1  ORF type:complete len:251 (+),score=45.68 TRINITY_DN1976_c0_g2_i3:80-832(+)